MAIQRVTAGQTEIATSGSPAATLHPWGLGTFQGPYQLPPLLGDGADVHGVALHHVQEPHFRDGDGADHVDPPGGAERVGSGVTGARSVPLGSSHDRAHRLARRRGPRLLLPVLPPPRIAPQDTPGGESLLTHLLSVVICRAPPRRLHRQHSYKDQTTAR